MLSEQFFANLLPTLSRHNHEVTLCNAVDIQDCEARGEQECKLSLWCQLLTQGQVAVGAQELGQQRKVAHALGRTESKRAHLDAFTSLPLTLVAPYLHTYNDDGGTDS